MHVGEEYSIIPAFIINMAGCNLTCPTCPERERWNHLLRPLPAEAYARALISHFDKTSWPKSIEWIGGEPATRMPYGFDATWAMRALHPELPTVYLNTNAYFSPFLNPMLAGSGAIDAFVFDLKASPPCARHITGASDYFDAVSHNILELARLMPRAPHILRHLVMPGHVECCTVPILEWCKKNVPDLCFNLMTTFHDFRRPPSIPAVLPQNEADLAIHFAKSSELPHLLINGDPA